VKWVGLGLLDMAWSRDMPLHCTDLDWEGDDWIEFGLFPVEDADMAGR